MKKVVIFVIVIFVIVLLAGIISQNNLNDNISEVDKTEKYYKYSSEEKSFYEDLLNKYNGIDEKVNSYDSYLENYNLIEEFYKEVYEKTNLYNIKVTEETFDYIKEILDLDMDYIAKYDELNNVHNDIYLGIEQDVHDDIYIELFTKIHNKFYSGVLSVRPDNVEYSEYSEIRNREYENYSTNVSLIYTNWSATRYIIYEMWSDMRSAVYSKDESKIQDVLNKYEEEIGKISSKESTLEEYYELNKNSQKLVENSVENNVIENILDNNIVQENLITENVIQNNTVQDNNLEEIASNVNNQDMLFKYKEIVFGNYNNMPIEWIVLDYDSEKILLISKNILDYKSFNDTLIAEATDWKNSTIRKWLNNDFINNAFSSDEKNKIITSVVQDYEEDRQLGGTTKDKMFLLNYIQFNNYLENTEYSKSELTEFAKTQNSYTNNYWWLIDSYSSELYKYVVNPKGKIENYPRVNEDEGIRPCMYIKNEYNK